MKIPWKTRLVAAWRRLWRPQQYNYVSALYAAQRRFSAEVEYRDSLIFGETARPCSPLWIAVKHPAQQTWFVQNNEVRQC